MKRAALGVALMVALGFAAGAEFLSVRRNLEAQRAAIAAQWNDLDAAFEGRAAAIVGFESALGPRGDAADAADALARAATPEAKIEANGRLTRALAGLRSAAAERIKPAHRRRLDEETGNAEARVAVERRKYNDLLEHYNAQLRRFPANIVAALSGVRRIDAYVPTEPEEQ